MIPILHLKFLDSTLVKPWNLLVCKSWNFNAFNKTCTFSRLASDMEAVMSKLRETEDLLEAVQTEKGNSEAQVTNVQHESTRKSSVQWILEQKEAGSSNTQSRSSLHSLKVHAPYRTKTDYWQSIAYFQQLYEVLLVVISITAFD